MIAESLDAVSGSYYQPAGDGRYQPTLHTQGAWQEHEQHMAPVSGLLTHALETFQPREDLQLARISFEILGMIAAEPSQVRCRVLRPGRTIELLEATLSIGGRDVVRATAWRLARHDTTEVAGGSPEPLPDPLSLPTWDGTTVWDGGYIASLEFRTAGDPAPGRARVWVRTPTTLIEGTGVSPVARFLGLVDTANGIATRVDPTQWMYPNTDLTVHLFRTPVDGWVGFDTTVTFGPSGVGLTSSTLHDGHGPVGRAEQILTVRRLPGR